MGSNTLKQEVGGSVENTGMLRSLMGSWLLKGWRQYPEDCRAVTILPYKLLLEPPGPEKNPGMRKGVLQKS
jgi:hypothetical protein